MAMWSSTSPTALLTIFCFGLLHTFVEATSYLFTDTTIISFNTSTNRSEVLRNSSLLIQNDRIIDFYNTTSPSSYPNDTIIVNATGKIISPGFVNTHHHLWQTALKTIASNTTLAEYFQRYGEFSPTIEYFSPEDKYLGQLVGALELAYSGTTTIVDHAHGDSSGQTADAILNATLESGIRIYHALAIHDLGNASNWTVDLQIQKLQSLSSDQRLINSSLVSLALAFDAFSNAPESQVKKMWSVVQNANLSLVTTHHLGGPYVVNNSPSLLLSLGWLNSSTPIIFSHASNISPADTQVLRQYNQYISTTPESEMHYGHDHPYAHLIQDQAALGVDTHFTFSADMVGQARLWLQNLRIRRYNQVLEDFQVPWNSPMSVEQAFYQITRAGGLALRRSDLGVISPGAKADLAIFSTDSPNMLGIDNPIAAIILHSNVGDVEDVLVGGRYVKRGGRLLYSQYADIRSRFATSARRIQRIWEEMDWPDFWEEDLFQDTTEYGTSYTVDTKSGDGTGYWRSLPLHRKCTVTLLHTTSEGTLE